jgi:glyoxylase-like metal-dependent hydrolase (beta-lactamase superfamily II)
MRITENVYLLESAKGSHVYLITGGETALVDTGFRWRGKAILKELALLHIRLQDIGHILLTHYDLDHIGNAAMLQKLTGASLWASSEDRPYILGEKHRPGFKKWLPYLFSTRTPGDIRAFTDGGKIGGIEIIPSPGHTPGHVCLLFEDVLFAGDLVKNEGGRLVPYPEGWNWDNSMLGDSIGKINRYRFKWVCPAHGMPVKTSELI